MSTANELKDAQTITDVDSKGTASTLQPSGVEKGQRQEFYQPVKPESVTPEPIQEIKDTSNKTSFLDTITKAIIDYQPSEASFMGTGLIAPITQEEAEYASAEREKFIHDKTGELKATAEDIENMPLVPKLGIAMRTAFAEAITLNSFPEVQQALQGQPLPMSATFTEQFADIVKKPETALYMASSLAFDMTRDLIPSLLTGGGYPAFLAATTLSSGAQMNNMMEEQKRIMANDLANRDDITEEEKQKLIDFQPSTYGTMAGGATLLAGAIAPVVGKYVVGKALQKVVTTPALQAAVTNTIENTGEYYVEQNVRDMGLKAAGQDPLGTNAVGAVMSGIVGLAGGYARGNHIMKAELDAYNKNLDAYIDSAPAGKPSDVLLETDFMPRTTEFLSKAEKMYTGGKGIGNDFRSLEGEIEAQKQYIDKTFADIQLMKKNGSPKSEIEAAKANILDAHSRIDVMKENIGDAPDPKVIEITEAKNEYYNTRTDEPTSAAPRAVKDGDGDTQYLYGGIGAIADKEIVQNAMDLFRRKIDSPIPEQQWNEVNRAALRMVREGVDKNVAIAENDMDALVNGLGMPGRDLRRAYTEYIGSEASKISGEINKTFKDMSQSMLVAANPDKSAAEMRQLFENKGNGKVNLYKDVVGMYAGAMPKDADATGIARYIDDYVDNLKIADPIFNAEIKNKLKDTGWIAPDDTATIAKVGKELSETVTGVARFKALANTFEHVQSLAKAGGYTGSKSLMDVTNNKVVLSEKEFKDYGSKYMNLLEKYRTNVRKAAVEVLGEDKVTDMKLLPAGFSTMQNKVNIAAFNSANPLYIAAAEKFSNNLRTMGKGTGWMKNKFNNFMLGDGADPGLLGFIIDNKIDTNLSKVVKYLDSVDRMQSMNQLELTDGVLMGQYNTKYPKKLADEIGLSDAEVVLAHKTSNWLSEMHNMYLSNSNAKKPYDLMGNIHKLKTFGASSEQFKGNAYWPRVINDAKAKQLVADNPNLADDTLISSSFSKGRSLASSLEGNDADRLPHLQELERVVGRMSNRMFNKQVQDNLVEMGMHEFGIQWMNRNGVKNYHDLQKSVLASTPQTESGKAYKDLIKQYSDTMKSSTPTDIMSKTINKIGQLGMNIFTKAVLSPFRVTYQGANIMQVYNNMSMYTGYWNALKTMPKAFKSVLSFTTKNQWSTIKKIQNMSAKADSGQLKGDDLELAKAYKNYYERSFDPGQEIGHYSLRDDNIDGITEGNWKLANPELWNIAGKRPPKAVINTVSYINRMINSVNTISDLASRDWGVAASYEVFKDFKKRYLNRKFNTEEAALKNFQEASNFLGIDGLGFLEQKRLKTMMANAMKTGELDAFRDEYIYNMIDSGLYHYDAANRHGIYDAARDQNLLAKGLVRFTSWPLYDMQLHGRIIRDAKAGNYKPLARTVAAIGAGIMFKLWAEENVSDKNKLNRNLQKILFQRSKGTSLVTAVTGRYDHPLGSVGGVVDLYADAFKIFKGEDKAKVMKKYQRLFATPDTQDVKEIGRAGMKDIQDLVDTFRTGFKDNNKQEALEDFDDVIKLYMEDGLDLKLD